LGDIGEIKSTSRRQCTFEFSAAKWQAGEMAGRTLMILTAALSNPSSKRQLIHV